MMYQVDLRAVLSDEHLTKQLVHRPKHGVDLRNNWEFPIIFTLNSRAYSPWGYFFEFHRTLLLHKVKKNHKTPKLPLFETNDTNKTWPPSHSALGAITLEGNLADLAARSTRCTLP